jgi:hypothetical protein
MRVLALFLFAAATAFGQTWLEHVWGRISAVTKLGFEVDQNFNADPQSGYRRGKRQITFNSRTKFEESTREDLRVGRTVDILGLETASSGVRATRVIAYEGNRPVRMPSFVRIQGTGGHAKEFNNRCETAGYLNFQLIATNKST